MDMSHRMETAVNNNVSSTTSDEFIYDLYAVCNHFGSLQGGHYTGKLRSSIWINMTGFIAVVGVMLISKKFSHDHWFGHKLIL